MKFASFISLLSLTPCGVLIVSLSLFLCVSHISFSLFSFSLYLFLYLSLSLIVSVSLFLYVCLSLSLSLSVSPPPSPPLFLSLMNQSHYKFLKLIQGQRPDHVLSRQPNAPPIKGWGEYLTNLSFNLIWFSLPIIVGVAIMWFDRTVLSIDS